MQIKHTIPLIQAIFYGFTGIWPLIHLDSFLAVTGPKTDIWLVKTVGILIVPYSLLCFYAAFNSKRIPVIALANIICCLGLAIVDIYYYFRSVIKWVYLVDSVIEIFFLIYWVYYLLIPKKTINHEN